MSGVPGEAPPASIQTEVLIIGGGLAGLALAHMLMRRGIDYHLVEARGRLGGRILTRAVTANGETAHVDLGPAWFWPGQPRIAALAETLNLDIFEQYAEGDIVAEDQRGHVRRGAGFASMQGSLRMVGGLGRLIDGLSAALPAERQLTGRRVERLTRSGARIVAEFDAAGVAAVESGLAVLAVPPRVAAEGIHFTPDIGAEAFSAMRRIPTWMADQAKIVAVYAEPFWRQAGLSGDAMSQRGPMVEIHDASPPTGGPYALFGFVGFPAEIRQAHGDDIPALARDQLARLFGEAAADPIDLIVQDWARDGDTATPLDQVGPGHHPAYGLPAALSRLWDGRLIMGSTEVAPGFGGYLEGALEVAENADHAIEAMLG